MTYGDSLAENGLQLNHTDRNKINPELHYFGKIFPGEDSRLGVCSVKILRKKKISKREVLKLCPKYHYWNANYFLAIAQCYSKNLRVFFLTCYYIAVQDRFLIFMGISLNWVKNNYVKSLMKITSCYLLVCIRITIH